MAAGKGWADTPPAATDPLLDLFVKKGYVTQQEAEQVEAEAAARQTNGAAYLTPEQSKWKITEGIKSVQLYGDIRFRYENRDASDQADNHINLQRVRYAIRFGLRGDAFDDFYYGFRLETASNPRSPWVSLGTSSSTSPYQGPFGKSTDSIGVGQVYLGWHPASWVDVTIGKMPNLLYTTPMVWDSDINPEGLVERFKYTVGQADLFATLGQFYYADFNPNNVSPGLGFNLGANSLGQSTMNIFMFAWQGGFTYHITPKVSAKIAATLYNYTGLQGSAANGTAATSPYFGDTYVGEGGYYYDGGSARGFAPGYAGYSPGTTFTVPAGDDSSLSYPFNQVGLNDLMVVEVPFELNFKVDNLAARIFGDFAYNLEGAQRAQAASDAYSYILSQNTGALGTGTAIPNSFAAQTHDVKAYQIGIGFGSDDMVYGPTEGLVYGTSTHKHDWEFRTYWQHIEQYALDPNLVDSDFFEGRENLEGIYAAFAYAVSDNFIITLRYGYAHRINSLLGTGGDNQDIPQMNPINEYHLLQADATLRF
ncbi:MAG TPA: putative porin [Candidatus Acidoferrales bacterium]|nr:putative porin [Candidatus Acidoferrales bacterium]